MDWSQIFSLDLFQGLATLAASEPQVATMRLVLILLGGLLIYLGYRGALEALIMVPMGLGMAVIWTRWRRVRSPCCRCSRWTGCSRSTP